MGKKNKSNRKRKRGCGGGGGAVVVGGDDRDDRAGTSTTTTAAAAAEDDDNNSSKGKDESRRRPNLPPRNNGGVASSKNNNRGGGGGGSGSHNGAVVPLAFPGHLPRPKSGLLRGDDPTYRLSFEAALETSYEGFVVDEDLLSRGGGGGDNEDLLDEKKVAKALRSRRQLRDCFRVDVTQPFGLGTKCAKTYVTRCLVGEAGTTYKYLGLRMFAYPWPTAIGRLRDLLEDRTASHLRKLDGKREGRGAPPTRGRAEYDICLINKMTIGQQRHKEHQQGSNKNSSKQQHLKVEPVSKLKTAVSWHADSSLEHYSTIAVYQLLLNDDESPAGNGDRRHSHNSNSSAKNSKDGRSDDWTVALRVAPGSEGPQTNLQNRSSSNDSNASKRRKGPRGSIEDSVDKETPFLGVSLPSNSAYYMLDDFNHHHQHAVLTTSTWSNRAASTRYSLTYRLLRESHNVAYQLARCQRAAQQFHTKGHKVYRSEQLLLTEIESEWIRQFYVQGRQHRESLWATWGDSIRQLLRYWSQLERRTYQTEQFLVMAARGQFASQEHPPPQEGGYDRDGASADTAYSSTTTKAERRKLREKQRKAVASMKELLDRESSSKPGNGNNRKKTLLYEMLADAFEERAVMRELWSQREKDPVFREMDEKYRPLPLPFVFDCDVSTVGVGGCNGSQASTTSDGEQEEVGMSPLPGTPEALRQRAADLRAYGRAYCSGNPQDLPASACESSPPVAADTISHSDRCRANTSRNDGLEDAHPKPLEWPGWGSQQVELGLEMQCPWAEALIDGRKSIETRAYELPPGLIGKWIAIIQTPRGKAGISAIGDWLDFGPANPARIVGWCKFSELVKYDSRHDFEKAEKLHLVASDSGYGWKNGTTKAIFGWVVGEYKKGNDIVDGNEKKERRKKYTSAVRRMRSLYQLL